MQVLSVRIGAPSTISSAAQRFINEAAPLQSLELTTECVARMRREGRASFEPPGQALLESLGGRLEHESVAGVDVAWVVPRKRRGAGMLLYFFGGGHVLGSPEEDLAITARLADETGLGVCMPRYRLSPEHPYPAALDDARAVYGALSGHGPIAVAGESAGGNLSLALTHRLAAEGDRLPAALLLLSPWCDLTHSGDTIKTLDGIDPTLDFAHLLQSMARAYAGGKPLDHPGVSPLFADVPKDFPPTLITTGTRDLLLSDCARLSTKLRQAGVSVDLHVAEGLWHVFEFYPQLPEAKASLRQGAAFILRHLPG